MNNLIVDLPRNLSVIILSVFLKVPSIVKLDSAFCTRKLRQPFLELLGCAELLIKDNDNFPIFCGVRHLKANALCHLRWYVARSVKIRCVSLDGILKGVDAAEIVKFVNVTCKLAEKLTARHLNITKWVHKLQFTFNNLRSLEWFHMPGRGEELAAVMQRAPSLGEMIVFSSNPLDGEFFRNVLMPSMRKILLVGTFGESSQSFWGQCCPNVTSLNLHLPVPEKGRFKDPAAVAVSFKQLAQLFINNPDVKDITDADLILIADGCPLLRHVGFRLALSLTDVSVTYLCHRCVFLESIGLPYARHITSVSLQAMAENLSGTLRELDLSYCEAIDSIAALQSLPNLEFLYLRHSVYIHVLALNQVLSSCSALRAVDVGSRGIDDATLRTLAHNCPFLQQLSIDSCTGYTPSGLLELAMHARQLKRLKLSRATTGLAAEAQALFHSNGCVLLILCSM